jgi:hypothetical protein
MPSYDSTTVAAPWLQRNFLMGGYPVPHMTRQQLQLRCCFHDARRALARSSITCATPSSIMAVSASHT